MPTITQKQLADYAQLCRDRNSGRLLTLCIKNSNIKMGIRQRVSEYRFIIMRHPFG